jgi:hypothetical protein
MAGQLKRRNRTSKDSMSLLDLVAADRAEYGPWSERKRHGAPQWTSAEARVAKRYARAVLAKKYGNAVLAVEPCRAELARAAKGSRFFLRTRTSVHARLVSDAIALGRVKSRVRWTSEEKAVLDRFARAVADGRIPTARGAGKACVEALRRLHRRYPEDFAGAPDRNEAGVQGRLWPRVAKLRSRWFNSHWSQAEMVLVDRYSRLLIAHRFPHVRAASKACREAINRMHARLARRRGAKHAVEVRTLAGVFDQILTSAKEIAPFQIPHRHWTAAEHRVAARWTRKYDEHRRGRLTMNLFTIAALLQAELSRKGYYRNHQACVTEIITQRRMARLENRRPSAPAVARAGHGLREGGRIHRTVRR